MRGWGITAALIVATAGCGSAVAQVPNPPGSLATADEIAPVLPFGMAPSFAAPPHDPAGGYITPNRDLSPDEVTWHVRVVLNVAALGCRSQAGDTAAAYNALLDADKAVLAAALDGVGTRFRARFGGDWQAATDRAMTKLYNFWAEPGAQASFCREAGAVLHEAQVVEPGNFPAFAAAVLPRLEAPFLAAFAAIDDYHGRLARWNGMHAPQTVIATVAAVPVGPLAGPDGP